MADGPFGDNNLGVTDETRPGYIEADGALVGVYRPIGAGLSTVGKWVDPDPRYDFEGDSRTLDEGYPGADQPGQ